MDTMAIEDHEALKTAKVGSEFIVYHNSGFRRIVEVEFVTKSQIHLKDGVVIRRKDGSRVGGDSTVCYYAPKTPSRAALLEQDYEAKVRKGEAREAASAILKHVETHSVSEELLADIKGLLAKIST